MPCILLVSARHGNNRVLRNALESSGYQCAVATGALELTRLLEGEKAVDLALVDSGPSCTDAVYLPLKEKGIPFFVISATRDISQQARWVGYGAQGFLQKPIAKSSLLQIVKEAIGTFSATWSL